MPSNITEYIASERGPNWRRNRKLVRRGFKDLEFLPCSPTGWNATLAALAYSARLQMAGRADLNLWAVMNGSPASPRYRELGEDALVLWHGTTAARAAKIAQFGLFHKRGLWAALEPRIAHMFSRNRALEHRAGSATIVLLLDQREVRPGVNCDMETPNVFRFHSALPPETIEYILWDERIEFLGERQAKQPKPWAIARFKKNEGQWVPLSQPPVRFDDRHTYSNIDEWLHLSIKRVLLELGSASAIEIFSSLYSTIHPWDALEHDTVFKALELLCDVARSRGAIQQLSLLKE